MSQILSAVLMVMWLMALVTGYTMNGRVHLLPIFAVLLWWLPVRFAKLKRTVSPK